MTPTHWARLRTALGAVILAVLLWRLGTGTLLDALGAIDDRALLAALGIGLATTTFSAWRWCLVAARLGLRLSLRTAVLDYYRALFLNAVLPGGVLGDVHRAVRHGRDSGDVGRGVRAVVLERTAGQVVLVAAGAAALLSRPALFPAVADGLLSAPALVAWLGVLLLVALVTFHQGRTAARVRRALVAAFADARAGLLARDTWPGVTALSVAALAGHLALFLVAARVAGATAPVTRLLPLLLLALLAMALPVNVGGWGPREGVLALAFGAAGLDARQGLAVSVVFGGLGFVSSLPGAGVLLARHLARPWPNRSQVELEERVLPQREAPHGGAQGPAHRVRAGKAQPRHPLAQDEGRDGHIEPVQGARREEP